MYTSEDVRASVSTIHERAQKTQQAPGARSGYRPMRRSTANTASVFSAQTGARSSAPLAPVFSGASAVSGDTANVTRAPGADLQREASTEITALLRRLDYLLSCQPSPSPALTRSLLRSMQREALALAGFLDALAPADSTHAAGTAGTAHTAHAIPTRHVLPVPTTSQECAPC